MHKTPDFNLPVLLVDDEPRLLRSASVILRSAGFRTVEIMTDGRNASEWLETHPRSIVVLDLTMPFISGQELLQQISENHPDVAVIIMTASSSLDTAVDCMRSGAIDYLLKPVDRDLLVSSVSRAMELCELRAEISSLKHSLLTGELENADAFSDIIARDPQMVSIFKYIEAIAKSPKPVLVTGETGTGKELIAAAVHNVSGYRGRFVAENISGLDDTVFADTLFGHTRGAYTTADRARPGLVAEANQGTLFLDEIGDLNSASQVKLLRLLQERQYYPLGSDKALISTARVVVATNRDLAGMLAEGTFRKDLYYRLRGHHIHIPPLRARISDLPLLLNHFIKKAADIMEIPVPQIPDQLVTLLKTYSFPGNIRELEAMVYDAIACHRKGTLSMKTFKDTLSGAETGDSPAALISSFLQTDDPQTVPVSLPTLKQAEQCLIELALKKADGNQGIAASILGISRQALNQRLNRSKNR